MTDADPPQVQDRPTGETELPSEHALGKQDRGTLLAFGIFCGLLVLIVIVGAILRAVN